MPCADGAYGLVQSSVPEPGGLSGKREILKTARRITGPFAATPGHG